MSSSDAPVEQVRSPGYPKDYSWIEFDHIAAGSVDALFKNAIQDHGNDDQFTWRSYAEGSTDRFTVRLAGFSDAPVEDTDYYQMHKWELNLQERGRKLVIDTGMRLIHRFEGEFLVLGTPLDVSDIIAASLNIRDYNEERRTQGWDPQFDDFLRSKGLI